MQWFSNTFNQQKDIIDNNGLGRYHIEYNLPYEEDRGTATKISTFLLKKAC